MNVLLSNSKVLLSNSKTLVNFKNLKNATNLKAWYSARLSTVVADSTAVSAWTDLSPASTAITQATAGKRPLYRTNIINGLPAWQFDGSNDVMAFTSSALTQNKTGLTTYAVWKRLSGTGVMGVFSFQNNASSSRHSMAINSGAGTDMFAGARRVTETAATASIPHQDTLFHIGVNVTDYANNLVSLYLDGELKQSAVIGGTAGTNSQNAASSGVDSVGSINDAGSYFNGYIAEFLFCDAAHTGEEIVDIMAMLQHIYGGLPQ
jgi:hypothetical protein